MPRIKSAKKRMRQSAEARERNRAQRSQLRTAVKKVRGSAKDEAASALSAAEKTLDRAGRKRLIHPNAAARLKSRLAKAAKGK
ncbi:MAG TPA: 30S ribosomal protein S20 [Gemmatimonadales bacterium]|nr:30S ribosomal protein S20 [Gemmatimonadales bacterium]